ncbi:D-alanyl-D-alanine carboxypeptidase family protein, partial [Streptomyces drozdowiczii]|uniref:D-alanyl-D-alanine carboxypeptidase family protein n=1 Tax=Streptomyces drozdowiczii TaxID=202862 RepID=UPI0027E2835A
DPPDEEPPAAEAKKPTTGENSPDEESPAAEAPAPDEKPSADEEPPAAKAPASAPVDQPTAVFKAPRLPKVDQPTTALKIKRSPSGQPVAAESESLAERTSQFVPLRSDDVRRPPAPRTPENPAAAPGAPAALSGAERTRQQPMPPKPPLDLLAELTNTPPPPETPVRTAVRRVKIWTPLVILLLIVFAIAQMVRPLPDPSLTMTAKETYGFEGGAPKLPWPDQGQGYMAATGLGKVDSFGEQKPVPIASVAKAMTAYLVLKSHPLKRGENGPDIKIDAKAEADGKLYTEGESTLNTVKEGDILTERDALAAIMIPSANNIARLLARWEAGSEKAFVAKMNATADELGMKNTTYTDPSGLTASTVSTAEDLVKLGEKLVEFPALMDITKLPEWKDPSGHKWRNYNTLVPYDGALGIKTGSTSKAGGNLLFAAHKMIDGTDQLVVGAILGQYDDVSIIDEVNRVSKKVMVATLDLLQGAKIVKKGDVVGEVDDGMGHTTPVVATKDVKAVGWSGLTVKLELTDDGRTIPHEAVAGTHVGTLTVGEGRSQVKVAVALQSDLAKPSFGDKLTRVG